MTRFSRKEALEQLESQALDIERLLEKPLSQWRLALRRFRGRKSGMIGLGVVVFLILVAIFAGPIHIGDITVQRFSLAPYPPNEVLIGVEDVSRYDPPSVHVLGCPEDQPPHIMGLSRSLATPASCEHRCSRSKRATMSLHPWPWVRSHARSSSDV